MDDEKIMEIAKPFIKVVGDHWCTDWAIRDNGDIEDFANALLAANDQRIAELEAENAKWHLSAIDSEKRIAELEEVIQEGKELISAYQKGAEKATMTINRLQAERVPTDWLEEGLCGEALDCPHCLRIRPIIKLRRSNEASDE